ncbi:MAG: SHOCT domain-containing protein [Bacteroidia bacterium]
MISHELRAQATLAYHNWKLRNPDLILPLSEEDFLKKIEELQVSLNKGLMQRRDFDERLADLLKNPPMAVGVSQFTPQEKPTDSLLRELESLKKSGVLSDEQFEERKAELYYQRGVQEGQPAAVAGGAESPEARKARFSGYLDELLQAGILSHSEFAMAQQRLR